MFKILFIVFMTVVSFNASASAGTQQEKNKFCLSLLELSDTIVEARDRRVPLATTIESLGKIQGNELLKIMTAIAKAIYLSPEMNSSAVQLKVFDSCTNSLN
jgi:ribosome biogenesis GTPase A